MEDYGILKNEELAVSIEKELEKENEELKLKETVKLIGKEILNYIDKRKNISEYILDYRKNVIDEYRDDEDKIVEYFDHERFVKEESFRTIDRRLKELIILKNTPYFGKVNFVEASSEESESIYIGRFGMTPEDSYEPVVVDWRAPISALFYSGKLGNFKYNAPMGKVEVDILLKRQFVIKRGKLEGMFDSALDVKDDILQMVLSANSSEKLKDIIMTIQEEQDSIIRQPKNKTVVVNGVAGSGKTTIALHRIAYLLYNNRESLQDKVLIIGPNNIFMEYISTVLPSLGEVGVKQKTFKDFAMDILNIDGIMSFKEYIEKVFSKDDDFVGKMLYKNSEEFSNYLDEEVNKLDKHYFHIEDVVFRDSIVVTKSEINDMFSAHFSSMPLFRRSKKIRRIIFSKLKDVRNEIVRNIDIEYQNLRNSLTPQEFEVQKNNLSFNRRIKIREVIKDLIEVKNRLNWINNPSLSDIYSKINDNENITYDDLAPMLYLKLKLEGIKLKEEIKHVVIDEAQDYSYLQFKVIKEITKCISMTVVGDINQRLSPTSKDISMLNLKDIFSSMEVDNYTLDKSYRSTREIMEYANKYLEHQQIIPLVRNGKAVTESKYDNLKELVKGIDSIITTLKEKGYESVAIVCKGKTQLNKLSSALKEIAYIKLLDEEDMIYNGGTVLLPSYFAKGLEFDAVIVIDDANKINTNKEDSKIKYVMCTRALHELYVLHCNI